MPTRFAINGLGRIGRALLRIAWRRGDLELVAVNDIGTAEQLGGLLARDSLHGPFDGEVVAEEDALVIDGRRIAAFQEPQAEKIPWLDLDPQVVVDATGWCKTRELALAHQRGGVRKVIVSANAAGMDLTVCVGVNHQSYDPARHHLLSASSCTTNCLGPVVHLLDRRFGLRRAFLNTVHSYNNDQRLLGFPHRDPRRARAAAINMVPTSTSAVQAIGRILPEMAGRIEGFAVRVPTPNVSLIDLVAELEQKPRVEEVNRAFSEAAQRELKGILAVSEEELVSSDFLGNPHSAIVDLPLTRQIDRRLYRVVAWYDNEWGHASRLADLLEQVGRSL
ncbi:MAG: type I glyceraldehyde-3-phosphate dehydrogenase [Thermoanaerobaculia bacterium]